MFSRSALVLIIASLAGSGFAARYAVETNADEHSEFCGGGCVMCPPGTHDAGTCQPNYNSCGYNGALGEMLESFDGCGGPSEGHPMLGGGMGGNMYTAGYGGGMGGGMMGGGFGWLQTTDAKAERTGAKLNVTAFEEGAAKFCGGGCVMCPPGTHDAGTCQPNYNNCGYNGALGEMLESFDRCGGPSEGHPMLGGGMGGNMNTAGYGGGMGGGMMGGGMMVPAGSLMGGGGGLNFQPGGMMVPAWSAGYGGGWLETKSEAKAEKDMAKVNATAFEQEGAKFCGGGCVMCPPGTHDAGTCQPNYNSCGYNGALGEMLESFDGCGGPSEGHPMLGGGMGGNMYTAGYMGGMGGMGGWLETKSEAKAEKKAEAKLNGTAFESEGAKFCGGGCVMCPPGTHDAGTCQPNYNSCGYNGALGEMLESFDGCGGPSEGHPMLGGGMGGNMYTAGYMGGMGGGFGGGYR